MSDSSYLSWVILVIVAEYVGVVLIVVVLYNMWLRWVVDNNDSSCQTFFSGPSLERAYLSTASTYCSLFILFLFRIFALAYLMAIAFVWNLAKSEGRNAITFSLWQICLVLVYFLVSGVASLIGLLWERERRRWSAQQRGVSEAVFWSPDALRLATTAQILFEIAGGSSFFVTLAVFVNMPGSHDWKFWNVTEHLVPSLLLVVDMFLNKLSVRWEHIVLNESWQLIYLILLWSTVSTQSSMKYPYGFMSTTSADALTKYSISAAISCAMYLAWGALGMVKKCFHSQCLCISMTTDSEAAEFEGMDPYYNYRHNAPPTNQTTGAAATVVSSANPSQV
jgi:hypothetical protein